MCDECIIVTLVIPCQYSTFFYQQTHILIGGVGNLQKKTTLQMFAKNCQHKSHCCAENIFGWRVEVGGWSVCTFCDIFIWWCSLIFHSCKMCLGSIKKSRETPLEHMCYSLNWTVIRYVGLALYSPLAEVTIPRLQREPLPKWTKLLMKWDFFLGGGDVAWIPSGMSASPWKLSGILVLGHSNWDTADK